MRILVCAKQVTFTYARTGRDPVNNYILPEDNIFRINPYDEAALELALGIKEKDKTVEVFILTLGPLIAEKELRRCIAIGADAVYRIDTEDEHDSWSKSVILAQGIRELKADLIFCGKESVDKQNGQVGAFIAHHLELPFVSDVMQVEMGLKSISTTKVVRNAGRGVREEVECSLPAVISVSQAVISTHLPTHELKEKALISPFKILDIDIRKTERKIFCKKTFPPRPRPKRVLTPDSGKPAFDRINQLLAGSSVEKKGAILTGDTASQVEGIISYLVEKGFLETKNFTPKKKG
jgi:electron transfer flavoprotein beta subunit